jgi:hypothetical protein
MIGQGYSGNRQAQFTGLKAGYLGEKSSPYIVKHPGESWGANLNLQHKGKGGTFYAGIGFAYGKLVGHNPPFAYAVKSITCTDDTNWKNYSIAATSAVLDTVDKEKLIDCQRFISDIMPSVGQQPPNPYGVNNWDDEIYVVRTGGEPEVHELIHLPVTGMPDWTLDRYYNIDWVRVRLTVDSIQGGTEQRVSLWLVDQGAPRITDVLKLTGRPLKAGYVWDQESNLEFFGGVLSTNYIYLGTSWCKIRDIHVWYREAASASQVQALLSNSYL